MRRLFRALLCLAALGCLFLFQSQLRFESEVSDAERVVEEFRTEPQDDEEYIPDFEELVRQVQQASPLLEDGNQFGSAEALPEGSGPAAEPPEHEEQLSPPPPPAVAQALSAGPLPWFLADKAVEPPGFARFRAQVQELQERGFSSPKKVKWVVFSGFNGLGNWMLGVSSALLVAALTGRAFALLEGPDVCAWMDSPLCSWTKEAPAQVIADAKSRLSKKPPKNTIERVDVMQVHWRGCSFQKLRCGKKFAGDMTLKPVLVFLSGAWAGEVLMSNPVFAPKLREAFERRLLASPGRAESVILDIYGPLSRWLFAPSAELKKDLDAYLASTRLLTPGVMSVCIQGRWGNSAEFVAAERCVDGLRASSWWPKGNSTALHVASMKDSFRRKVRSTYAQQGVPVTWPEWDAHVKGQKDDAAAYKDMLLLGSCRIAVLPNGGSTFSWAPTAMYHTVSIRDAGVGKHTCKNLPVLPYEKLFPQPRQQLDKTCFKKGGKYDKPC